MALAQPLSLEKQFALAQNHAKRIKLYRRILPLAMGALALLFALIIFINPFAFQLPFNVERFTIRGTKLTMENPHMTGYMKNKQSYRIKAERAEQDLKEATKVELFQIHADFEIDGGNATLTAREGLMITDKELINLLGGVHLVTTTGYEGLSEIAEINPKTNLILLPKRVDLKSPTGAMSADRMEIHNSQKFILFEGNVEGFFYPSKPDADKEEEKGKNQ
jgi:lipopolysaccharide export system protein LptC